MVVVWLRLPGRHNVPQWRHSKVTEQYQKVVINEVAVNLLMPGENKSIHIIGIVKPL